MMIADVKIGETLLKKKLPLDALKDCEVVVARTLHDFQQVVALRSAVFMAEQVCPFDEEFDGNDLVGTHLIARVNGEPAGCLRLRWFAGFAKLERVCVLPRFRGSPIIKLILASCFELSSRKGYTHMVGHIQSRLVDLWTAVFVFTIRENRPKLTFSNFDYTEIDIAIPLHPDAIDAYEDAYRILRPEGDWDTPGILDAEKQKLGQAA